MSSTAILNKLSWNGLIIIFQLSEVGDDGVRYIEYGQQTFDEWSDLAFDEWKVPPSSPYPDIDEILGELFNYTYGEHPLAVFDRNRNLIWESSPGCWAKLKLPLP